jgi:hypothetical protein
VAYQGGTRVRLGSAKIRPIGAPLVRLYEAEKLVAKEGDGKVPSVADGTLPERGRVWQ